MTEQSTGIPIWFLQTTERGLRLFPGHDSQYFVIEDGAWTPILYCGLFALVNEELLSFFKQYAYHLESHPAMIIDRVLNQTFNGYHRIYIKDEIDPGVKNIHEIDASGIKIWHRQGAIFISNELKELLDQTSISGITPAPGFSGWGG